MSFTPTILRYDSLPSTNDEAARQAAAGVPEGLCVVAREQTAGRGRQRRAWLSPKDAGLYFSVVLRPRFEPSRWPLVTFAAALAVADALSEVCGVETDIKWPNDLLARERKICGILAETFETKAGRALVVGIGVNLDDRAFPPDLRESATSVAAESTRPADAEELLRSLTRSLARRYGELHAADGARATLREWAARSSYAEGKRVRVALAAEVFKGRTRGLEPDGALRVETTDGRVRVVRAGDVTAVRSAEG